MRWHEIAEATNFKSVKTTPLSAAEQQKALTVLQQLERASADRQGGFAGETIDIRSLGLLSTRDVGFGAIISNGQATDVQDVPLNKIVASQSSVSVAGLEAYIGNAKLDAPVLLAYADRPYWCVLAGHTRIGAQALAGRTSIKAIIVPENSPSKRRGTNWNH